MAGFVATAAGLGAIALALSSCASTPADPIERANEPPSSFERIESHVFARSCAVSGCHAGVAPTGELSLDSGRAYGSLVGVVAANAAARDEGLQRVRPSDPGGSFLLRKLSGELSATHGARMPLGSTALHSSEIEFIRQWIAAGAPRSGSVADTSLLSQHHTSGSFGPLAPPSHGFQLHLPSFPVAPHREREVFYATAGSVSRRTYMTGFRVAMRDNSHHFTLYGIPEGGANLPIGVVRDRGNNNDEFLRNRLFLFGTQEADVSYSLPPGVGVVIEPSYRMDINLHAVNPTDDEIAGEAYVNVFTSDHVERVAEPLLWSYHQFVLPANSTSVLHDTLDITDASDLLMLTTHFHKHGREFVVYVMTPAGERRIYESHQWDHPLIARYDTPIRLEAGDRLRLVATYVNETNVDIYYGASSEAEMCSIFGLVVKRD